MLRFERFLKSLDQVLSVSARMSMGFDRFTLTEATFAVANIWPARLQILRRLCRFMIRNFFEDFITPGRQDIPGTYLLPRGIAKAWFRRIVDWGGLCQNPVPTHKQVLFVAVDRAYSRSG